MKRDLRLAGKAIAGGGLTGAVLYLVATAPTNVRVYWPYWIFLAMIVLGVALYLAGQERTAARLEQADEVDQEELEQEEIAYAQTADQTPTPSEPVATTAGPVITNRWRHTSDGGQVPALMRLSNTVMFHPGYGGRQAQDTPPSVKIGMLLACQPIDPTSGGTELRAKFVAFLQTEPVRNLIAALTHVDPGMSWKSLAGNGPRTLEAALTASDNALDGVPAASALLLPPVAGESLYGRSGQAATLLLYVEPRTSDGQVPSALGLAAWHQRFILGLAIPGVFAEFLAKDLGLGTSDHPPAQLGVWLQSYHPLTTVVDTQGLRSLPGSSPSNWFSAWAFAASDGRPQNETAQDFLSQLCEYTLHLDGFEQALDEICTGKQPARDRAVDSSCSSPEIAVESRELFADTHRQVDRAQQIEQDAVHRLGADGGRCWVVVSLVPDLAGKLLIDQNTLRAAQRELVGARPMVMPTSLQWTSVTVGRRCLLAGDPMGDSLASKWLSADLHHDGAGVFAVNASDVVRAIHSGSPPPEGERWLHDEQAVNGILTGLRFLSRHARERAAAAGKALVRVQVYPVDQGIVYLGTGGRGISDRFSRSHLLASTQPAEAITSLDNLVTDGPELITATYALASDLFQAFGQSEAAQLTRDGRLRLPYWSNEWRQSVEVWAAAAGVAVTTETLPA
jgi:hypothetical protein